MKTITARILVMTFLAVTPAALADEDRSSRDALLQRIKALEVRVAALEAVRSFAGFMPEYAERFHIMHRAGEAGDWPVAAHELAEMQRLTRLAPDVDARNGQLMISMMGSSLGDLGEAIEHGNTTAFQAALRRAVDACNGCHVAAGSPFIDVTLSAPDSLSMRHPHKLRARAPQVHEHGEPAGGAMMKEMHEGGDADHHGPGAKEAEH